ncbi:thioredoxin family protein, partial [Burkholderia sola]|uniref:thioredoxin family protein n=1 Tax=Burkholderia sola TaxID=2843302 RepID=UPI00338F3FCC
VNKRTTLNHEEVLAAFEQRGVTLLRADWTRRDPAITAALQQLGRSGVPVYVLHAPGKPPVVLSELLSKNEVLGRWPRFDGTPSWDKPRFWVGPRPTFVAAHAVLDWMHPGNTAIRTLGAAAAARLR